MTTRYVCNPQMGGLKKKKEYNDGVFFTAVLWDLRGSKDLERGLSLQIHSRHAGHSVEQE